MSKHDPRGPLLQIRDDAQSLLDAVAGKAAADFPAGDLATDGLIRRLSVIGGVASRVPLEMKAQHPTIRWHKLIDLPDRLVRHYDTVELDFVWRIIHEELPPLLEALRQVLGEIPRRT